MSTVSGNSYDLGPLFESEEHGPDRALLAHCLGLIKAEPAHPMGWAIEFGVGSGHTLRMIAEVLPVIGFDSFMGLPEDWRPGFPKGKFRNDPPKDIPGATLVQGWFEDTVPDYEWPDKIALVHFDADLYSSTKTCLDAIGPAWRQDPRTGLGPILVFDEFFGYEGCEGHEQRAWFEYAAEWDLSWDVIGHGREQWAVRLK